MNTGHPVVVYDACALYPALLRDFLMQLGLAQCLSPKWSRRIQDEWKRSLLRNQPVLSSARLDRTTNLMEEAIPEALVEPDEAVIASLQLPDPDDRHVLATAIRGGASLIMTFNERDFPDEVLGRLGIVAQHPDRIIVKLLQANPDCIVFSARQQRAKMFRPVMDKDEYLAALRRQGLVQTSLLLANYRDRL